MCRGEGGDEPVGAPRGWGGQREPWPYPKATGTSGNKGKMEGYVNTSRKNGERTASSYERGYLNIEEVTRELSESKSMIVKTRKKL